MYVKKALIGVKCLENDLNFSPIFFETGAFLDKFDQFGDKFSDFGNSNAPR